MNERPELRTLIVLRFSTIAVGNPVEKARRPRRQQLAVPPPLFGVRDVQLSLGAGDADVEQPPLFLEQRGSSYAFASGNSPSSSPVMNTTGNSSPFALCSVISVTASASGRARRHSATSVARCRK